jgi:hypothetical protein
MGVRPVLANTSARKVNRRGRRSIVTTTVADATRCIMSAPHTPQLPRVGSVMSLGATNANV